MSKRVDSKQLIKMMVLMFIRDWKIKKKYNMYTRGDEIKSKSTTKSFIISN